MNTTTKQIETRGPFHRSTDFNARDRGYTVATLALVEKLNEIAATYEATSEFETGTRALLEREAEGIRTVLALIGDESEADRRAQLRKLRHG